MSSARLSSYSNVCSGYINPTIIEERQLNVAQMDVFSRLMMDRIIFLGVGIDNDVANIIQAQLLFLESTDSSADIQKRSVLPHSRVLIHQPMGGAEGQASDIEIAAAEIKKLKGELYDIISKHSGQSLEKIAKDADRDYWMTASEAVAYGMADNILSRPAK